MRHSPYSMSHTVCEISKMYLKHKKSDRDELFEFALQLSEMEFITEFKIKIGDQVLQNWTLIQELEAQGCVFVHHTITNIISNTF